MIDDQSAILTVSPNDLSTSPLASSPYGIWNTVVYFAIHPSRTVRLYTRYRQISSLTLASEPRHVGRASLIPVHDLVPGDR